MPKSKYPRIGNKSPRPWKGLCEICVNPSVKAGKVEVQVNHMRGDDDVRRVCPECQRVYSNRGLLWQLGYIQMSEV